MIKLQGNGLCTCSICYSKNWTDMCYISNCKIICYKCVEELELHNFVDETIIDEEVNND